MSASSPQATADADLALARMTEMSADIRGCAIVGDDGIKLNQVAGYSDDVLNILLVPARRLGYSTHIWIGQRVLWESCRTEKSDQDKRSRSKLSHNYRWKESYRHKINPENQP